MDVASKPADCYDSGRWRSVARLDLPFAEESSMRASKVLLALASNVLVLTGLPARPAAPVLPEQLSPARTEVLEQFKVAGDGDYLIVPVTINGKQYPFMVDTGCGTTTYDVSLRPLMGPSAGRQAITGWRRTVEVDCFLPPRATLGKLPLPRRVPAPTYDFTAFRCVQGENIRGILGMDFLHQYVVCIDFDNETLTFQRGIGHMPGRPLHLSFDEEESHVFISANVLEQCPPEKFLLDTGEGGTGSLRTNLFKTASKLRKLQKTGKSMGLSLGYLGSDHQGRLASLHVGKFAHRRLTLGCQRWSSLGLDYLSHFHVTFDFPGRQLFLKQAKRFGRQQRQYHSGLRLWRPYEAETLVWDVHAGSPAAKAAVKVGDRIVSVAGLPVDGTRLYALRQRLCSSREPLQVTLERDNQVIRVSFRPDTASEWADDDQESAASTEAANDLLSWLLREYVKPYFLEKLHEKDDEEVTQPSVARVAALLNGEEIDEDAVTACALKEYLSASDEEKKKIRKRRLKDIIECEMILQAALPQVERLDKSFVEKLRACASRQFEEKFLRPLQIANRWNDVEIARQRLAEYGVSLDCLRRQWERNAMAVEVLRSVISDQLHWVGLRQIQDYYHSHTDEFRIEQNVKWQDLFICVAQHATREAARAIAGKLLTRIRNGEDFVRLSKEHDNGDSSLRPDSEGIGRKHGEIRPSQLETRLFRMSEGEVALIEMEHGFHIVKLVKRQETGTRPLDYQLQATIYQKLLAEEYRKGRDRLISQLREDAVVIVYDTVPQIRQPAPYRPTGSWLAEKNSKESHESAPWGKSYVETFFSTPFNDIKSVSDFNRPLPVPSSSRPAN
jgi:hypothetical protein